ncbi:MAG: hypothetical protein AAGE59_20140 [Cyanobacteria bacterium P01_F01_bin.86]
MPETSNQSSETSEMPRGPGAVFTFVYYFSGAALVTVLFTAKTLGVGFGTVITGELALLVGSLSGLLGVFYNRTKTLEIAVTKPKAFTRQMEAALADMGYTLAETIDDIAVYQRSSFSRLFTGDIYVQKQEGAVVLVSRAANIRTLEKRLR